jgi:uncharacterized protein YlxW (UPF0749 family)
MMLTAVPYLLCAIWQMETMKKAYHGACKEEKLATSRENNSKLENNSNPEAQKKMQDKVEKCQQEMEKVGMGWEWGVTLVLNHLCVDTCFMSMLCVMAGM